MRQIRAGHHKSVPRLASFIPRDFDQIEEAEDECVRQVLAGHTFDAAPQGPGKAHNSKIYSL